MFGVDLFIYVLKLVFDVFIIISAIVVGLATVLVPLFLLATVCLFFYHMYQDRNVEKTRLK